MRAPAKSENESIEYRDFILNNLGIRYYLKIPEDSKKKWKRNLGNENAIIETKTWYM